jgi:hypothetical protein
MSRSNNTEVRNPAEKFFQWSGSEGKIKYYDKETKENVFVDTPFTFLVLDKLITITGYSDEDESGFWSNEIRNVKRDVLTVRTKKGIRQEGFYDEVKHLNGAKFAQSVYIAYYDEKKKLTLGNFKFNGCAVSSWIEFCKGRDVYSGAIKIIDSQEDKKGATTYFSPVFEAKPDVSEQTEEAARELDRILQEYLTKYFAMRGETNEPHFEPASDNESYIEQRNKEIAEFDKRPVRTDAELLGGNDFSVKDDFDIPF